MKIQVCSFATNSFKKKQKLQREAFLYIGFRQDEIHSCDPTDLNEIYYKRQLILNENNRFGWFTFKPFLIYSLLEKLDNCDVILYLDVNDKPVQGIKEYLIKEFQKQKKINILCNSTNYPNILYSSRFHRLNLTKEMILSSIFFFQPEAGALAIRNNLVSKSILKAWYEFTLMQAFALDNQVDLRSRHDQETLFNLSRLFKIPP